MRRKDREVTDPAKIRAIIKNCHCCRLGFQDHGRVYIVPLSFGYEEADGKYIFYFHGASEGRKMELIKREKYAGFELDTNYKLGMAETACGCTAYFQSIIGTGKVSVIEEKEQKLHALQRIMEHTTDRDDWTFREDLLKRMAIFKLEAEELSCKEHA